MTVYDRWHLTHPPEDAVPCRCSRGKTKLYPSAAHPEPGKPGGKRWQVRWYDEDGKQQKKNFAKKDGKNPAVHADALDALITSQLNKGDYIDPDAGIKPFETYAEEVLADRVLDGNTRTEMRGRLARHVYPAIGDKELRVLARRPTVLANLVARLEAAGLSPRSVALIMGNVGTIFACALDDELITRNPVKSKAVVRLPRQQRRKVVPWTDGQIAGMRRELPARFAAMVDAGAGLGLRQGEIFGLSPDDVEWLGKDPVVHVRRQVKVIRPSGLVFALPKGGKVREVPLPRSVAVALAEHMRAFPPREVALPWKTRDGDEVTVPLFFTIAAGRAVGRAYFNNDIWKPALERAGMPASARQNTMHDLRHYFASSLLTEGEAIQAVSEWLGHYDPTITLKIYAHLMPKSKNRMRGVIDKALEPAADDAASTLRSRP
jgi:integrase